MRFGQVILEYREDSNFLVFQALNLFFSWLSSGFFWYIQAERLRIVFKGV